MRIALLTYSTRPRGGVVHTLALAESLVELGAAVDVWTLARGGDSGFFRPVDPRVGLRIVPLPDLPDEPVGRRIRRSIAVLADAFDDAGYDAVHAQDCISANAVLDAAAATTTAAAATPDRGPARCVRTIHHLDSFTTPELAACHERAVVAPRAHVCVSAAVATEVERGWGIRPTVIANGVDASRFAAAADDRAGRRAWRDRLGPYVLAVGGIEPRKGTADLVEAMAAVQRARPDLSLVIAGGETLFDYRDYRESVLDRAARLGVTPRILGPVPHGELPALVAEAAAFAFPSTKEGFGLAALEALAAGVPVVARDLPVLREVLGGAVRYAATADDLGAALLAAASGCDAARLAGGRALAARYTWAEAARAHLAFYRRLGAAGRGGGGRPPPPPPPPPGGGAGGSRVSRRRRPAAAG
ncbi:MSMEG_0565 family glycosyltransferase [Frankia sp. AgB32]|uniref:MSMEG_0565 family glycosyltransferase n=1 Tax=Frankia sp. AgB32 TaxID=631119 RepID=UPI00200F0908|nr:MSMEG_0565 family glycosyltransferase [Frankia sp. AgB32]MCK9894929.1 MSMEG_0565 family glycosyltransferase [Frankia sp. AgB32]